MRKKTQYIVVNEIYKTIYCGYPQKRAWNVFETVSQRLVGEIVDLLETFKKQPETLMMPKMPEGSFAKKLYSLYLTYLPAERFK